MTAFGWIDDLARWLLRLVPRLTLVPPTHGGVVFGPRGGAHERGPGLVLWWPVVQQLHRVPTCVQSWQVAARAMPLDGNEDRIVPQLTIVGLAVQYVVFDPVLAATKVVRLNALVDNRAQAIIARHWNGDAAVSAAKTAVELNDDLRPFGVRIQRVDVVHSGTVVGILQLTEYGWSDEGFDSGNQDKTPK